MSDQLYFIQCAFAVKVIAFVLMDNHFHLIIHTPNSNLDSAMRWFMRETSRSITRFGGRINQTYSGRYFRSILNSDLYFRHAYKYVYLNPVRASLVNSPVDYRFSSLPYVLGLHELQFPVHDELLMTDTEETLSWLHKLPSPTNWLSVQKALRRRTFQISRKNRVPNPLETEPL